MSFVDFLLLKIPYRVAYYLPESMKNWLLDKMDGALVRWISGYDANEIAARLELPHYRVLGYLK